MFEDYQAKEPPVEHLTIAPICLVSVYSVPEKAMKPFWSASSYLLRRLIVCMLLCMDVICTCGEILEST